MKTETETHNALTLKALENIYAVQLWSALGENKVMSFVFRDQKISFKLPFGTRDLIQRKILLGGTFYELRVLEKLRTMLPPSPVILDIGANIGNHTVYFAKICHAARVICYEPQRTVFEMLVKNIELNGATDIVTPKNMGVGSELSYADISSVGRDNLGATSFTGSEHGNYPIRTVDCEDLSRLDMIKIDVEGMQIEVLRGALKTIEKFRPIIACELRSGRDDSDGTQALLTELGYRMTQIDTNNVVFQP
jgi:FkbM family methyltransferase